MRLLDTRPASLPAFSVYGPSPGFGPSSPPHSACEPDVPPPSLFAPSVTSKVCQTKRTGLAEPTVFGQFCGPVTLLYLS